MFVGTVAAVAGTLVLLGLAVEVLARRGVAVPGRRGESAVSRLGRLAADRPVFVVGAVAVGTLLALYPFVDAVMRAGEQAPPFGYWDFSAYTSALLRWERGTDIYIRNANGGFFGMYLYPPGFLAVIWPFYHAFEFREAAIAWQVSSVLFLWLALLLVLRELGHRLRLWERGALLWVMVGFHPLLFSVKQGQISAFLAGLITLSLWGLLRGRRAVEGGPDGDDLAARAARRPDSSWRARGSRLARLFSGAAVAVVGNVKLVYGPVAAHLLADRERFAGAVVTGLGVLLAAVVVFGVDAHLGYLEVLEWGKGDSRRSPLLWMRAYFQPLYGLHDFALPVRLLLAAGVSALALGAAGRGVDRELFALGVASMPVIAPHAYNYYLTALVPAVVILVACELERRDGRPLVPLAGLTLLHFHSYGLKIAAERVPDLLQGATHDVVPVVSTRLGPLVASLLQPGLWGVVLVGGLAAWRVYGAARVPPALSGAADRLG